MIPATGSIILGESHPARGAWIEIYLQVLYFVLDNVAPRKGCVD